MAPARTGRVFLLNLAHIRGFRPSHKLSTNCGTAARMVRLQIQCRSVENGQSHGAVLHELCSLSASRDYNENQTPPAPSAVRKGSYCCQVAAARQEG